MEPAALASQPADLVLGFAWVAGLWALGFAALGALGVRRLAASLALPTGACAAVPVLAIGALAGRLDAAAAALVAVGVAGAAWQWRARARPAALGRGEVWAAAACVAGAIAAVGFIGRPMPNYDLLSYHLPLAHWVADHGLAHRPGDFYSRLPLAAPLLASPVRSDWAGAFADGGLLLLLWAAFANCGLLCARCAGHLGARGLGRLVAAICFLAAAGPWGALANAQNDLLVVLFGLAALERLLASGGRRCRDLVLAGAFAGTAAAVKFSALGIVAAPLGLVLVVLVLRDRPRLPAALAAFAAGIAVGIGPWLLRSLLLAGHPLHPFVGEAVGWTAEQARFVVEAHDPRSIADPVAWWAAISHLLAGFGPTVVLKPSLEDGTGGLVASAVLAPLALAFASGSRRRVGAAIAIAGACFAGVLAWSLVAGNPARFVLPVHAWGAVLAGWGVDALRRTRPLRMAAAGVPILAAVFAVAAPGGGVRDLAALAWAPQRAWRDAFPLPPEMLHAIRERAGGDRIALLFEARGRLFPRDAVGNTVWDAPPWAERLPDGTRTAADFEAAMAAAGARWIVVNEHELARLVLFYGGHGGTRDEIAAASVPGVDGFEEVLARWPPMRFAGLEDDAAAFAEFLRDARSRSALGPVPGDRPALWMARIGEP